MLTLIAAASLALVLQVAEPTQDPPGSSAEAATAPLTDAKTRGFLEEATRQLYQPRDEGLTSLAFGTTFDSPIGPVTVLCNWTAEAGTSVQTRFELPEGVPPEQAEMLNAQMEGQLAPLGHQFVTVQLNELIENTLDTMVASLEGLSDEGMIEIRWTPKPGVDLPMPIEEQIYLFDDEGVLRRTSTRVSMMGQTREFTEVFEWQEVGDDGKLVLASQETSAGPMMSQTATFDRQLFGKLLLVTKMSIKSAMQNQDFVFSDIVINGEPVAIPADTTSEG